MENDEIDPLELHLNKVLKNMLSVAILAAGKEREWHVPCQKFYINIWQNSPPKSVDSCNKS